MQLTNLLNTSLHHYTTASFSFRLFPSKQFQFGFLVSPSDNDVRKQSQRKSLMALRYQRTTIVILTHYMVACKIKKMSEKQKRMPVLYGTSCSSISPLVFPALSSFFSLFICLLRFEKVLLNFSLSIFNFR